MSQDRTRYTYSFVSDLISEDVMSIAAYRAYYILEHNDGVLNEKSEIPFITSPVFPILLFGYLVAKRLQHLRNVLVGKDTPVVEGHVLSISSTATYRFRPFLLIAKEFAPPVTLLCTHSTREKIENGDITTDSWNVVSHNDFHGLVPLWSTIGALFDAIRINSSVADRLEVMTNRNRWIGFNLVFTELIKSMSFAAGKGDLKSFHTQSPSPYALRNVDENNFFLYQHGQGISMTERIAIADYHLTYFIWGPGWRPEEHVSKKAIDVINFVPIGNPVYDEMLRRRSERPESPAFDVLLFSQSHVLGEWVPEEYEEYVQTIINFCEKKGYRLGVKLHRPAEDSTYYERRGWGEYIVDGDIQDAIINSRITITDCSSAFLESVIMGSPAVLTQLMCEITDRKLAEQITGVHHTEDLKEIPDTITAALTSYPVPVEALENSGVFTLGGTAERIVEFVTADPAERSFGEPCQEPAENV